MSGTLLFNNWTTDHGALSKRGNNCCQEFIVCSDTRGSYKPQIGKYEPKHCQYTVSSRGSQIVHRSTFHVTAKRIFNMPPTWICWRIPSASLWMLLLHCISYVVLSESFPVWFTWLKYCTGFLWMEVFSLHLLHCPYLKRKQTNKPTQTPNQIKSNKIRQNNQVMQKLSLTTSSTFFLKVILKRNYS